MNTFLSIPNIVHLISLCLYGFSLFLPALKNESQTYDGFTCLGFGWFSIMEWNLGWLANLFYFGSFILLILKDKTFAVPVFAALSAILALQIFLHTPYTYSGGSGGNPRSYEAEYALGAYIWILSIVLNSAVLCYKSKHLFTNKP